MCLWCPPCMKMSVDKYYQHLNTRAFTKNFKNKKIPKAMTRKTWIFYYKNFDLL